MPGRTVHEGGIASLGRAGSPLSRHFLGMLKATPSPTAIQLGCLSFQCLSFIFSLFSLCGTGPAVFLLWGFLPPLSDSRFHKEVNMGQRGRIKASQSSPEKENTSKANIPISLGQSWALKLLVLVQGRANIDFLVKLLIVQ